MKHICKQRALNTASYLLELFSDDAKSFAMKVCKVLLTMLTENCGEARSEEKAFMLWYSSI